MKQAILILSFIALGSCASTQSLIFNHLQKKDGLSQNSIVAITQDSRGFMWYGSTAGLNRYDGVNFHIYKSTATDTTTLSDDYVRSLYSDSKGTLWVGTANGLNKFNPKENSFKRIYLKQPSGPNAVRAFYEDRKNHLWVATNKGLYLLTNRETSTFTSAQLLGLPQDVANSRILSMYEDSEGYLWIGSNKGLIRLRFDNRIRSVKKFIRSNALTSLSDNAVTAITEDKHKNLWVATENGGLNLFSRTSETFSRFLHDERNGNTLIYDAIRAMIRSKSGELWIGTQDGLSVFDPETKKFRNFQHQSANDQSLKQNSIYSIYEDINGSVWLGTFYGGVDVTYAHSTNFNVLRYSEKTPNVNVNVVSSVLEDKANNLWIGIDGGGLNYFNKKTQKFSAYVFRANDPGSIGSNLVKIVYKDKANNIWIGTHGGGLNLFDASTGKFKRFLTGENALGNLHSEIAAITEDKNGILWVGGVSGLGLFYYNNAILKPYAGYSKINALKNKNITRLFEDSKGNTWIATPLGLYRYDAKTNILKSIKLPKSNNSVVVDYSAVNCVQEDTKGNIWVGLFNAGLARYDENKDALKIIYTKRDGLPDNDVAGIVDDNLNHLWISTSNGLAKLDLNTKTFQTYTTSDGLAGDDFNNNAYFINKQGEVFLGGFNGLTHFFPNEIQKNDYRAPLVFTQLRLFNIPVSIKSPYHLLNQDISFTHKIIFTHDQNVITLDFALLNYIKSKKNKYAYRLNSVNNQWIETSTPSITYTNLPPGSYTLLVKGANNDGVWSRPISMQIQIRPPFWATWWAFCFYAIILGTVLFFITRFFYLRQLLLKDEELHQAKLTFFTNVSHEIRTHLTLIMASIEKLLDVRQDDDAINAPARNVKNNADRLLKLVSELLDFRKVESKNLKLRIVPADLVDFACDIYNSFGELANKKNIQFSIFHDNTPLIVYFDEAQLGKVFFNLISNALKFTPSGGNVTITIERHKDRAIVSVVDNGRGIAPEYQDRLFDNFFQGEDEDPSAQSAGHGIGLALTKNIVELHHGEITVHSNPAKDGQPGYTNFSVTLLLGAKHFKHDNYLQEVVEHQSAGSDEENIVFDIFEAVDESNPESVIKKYSVLIVEDNADLRSLIKESLESVYHIQIAKNGVEGFNKACEKIPDLIVSDVMMPKMDGVTLCNKLKTDERTSHIPVLLLTAKSSEADYISGLTGGADVYLTKPFRVKVLQLQIKNLLSAREALRNKFSRLITLEPGQIAVDLVDEKFISKLIRIIEDTMADDDFGVDMLANKIGMSQSVLYKKMKALTGMSINDFSKSVRLKRAAQLLETRKYTVYEVGYLVGFTDRKYFSREFKKQFGKTPTEYAC